MSCPKIWRPMPCPCRAGNTVMLPMNPMVPKSAAIPAPTSLPSSRAQHQPLLLQQRLNQPAGAVPADEPPERLDLRQVPQPALVDDDGHTAERCAIGVYWRFSAPS